MWLYCHSKFKYCSHALNYNVTYLRWFCCWDNLLYIYIYMKDIFILSIIGCTGVNKVFKDIVDIVFSLYKMWNTCISSFSIKRRTEFTNVLFLELLSYSKSK